MTNSISQEAENLIKEKESNLSQLKNLIIASEDYEKLIQTGMTKKRGFNILTTDEIYNPIFNYIKLQSDLGAK
jgi:hypothetical protein